MDEEKETSAKERQEGIQKLYEFVGERLERGEDKASIIKELVDIGIEEGNAGVVVDAVHAQMIDVAKEEEPVATPFLPGVIGGVLAAIIGGAVWGLIVIGTNYELGIIAWAIGFLCGTSVVLFSRGKRGMPLQIVAVLSSVLGILIGKYVVFYHYLKEAVGNEYGQDAASEITLLSSKAIEFFGENLTSIVGGFDILWVVFAVMTAWRIPKGRGIKRNP